MTSSTPLHALRVVLVLLAALSALASFGAVLTVVADLVDTTDEWHGYLVDLGLAALAMSVPPLVAATVALWLLRRPNATTGLWFVMATGGVMALLGVVLGGAFCVVLVPLGLVLVGLALAGLRRPYSDRDPSLPEVGQRR